MYDSVLRFAPEVLGENIGFLDLENIYDQHQWVWRCFDHEENQKLKEADFTYRIDTSFSTLVVYLRSKRKPKPSIKSWVVTTQESVLDYAEESLVQFSLRVNPTIAVRTENKRSQRCDVIMHAKKLAKEAGDNIHDAQHHASLNWLIKRQEQLGIEFLVQTLETSNYQQNRFKKKPAKKETEDKKVIRFCSLDYRGLFKVKDSTKLRQALSTGIGKSRAFGCGLMLIKPI